MSQRAETVATAITSLLQPLTIEDRAEVIQIIARKDGSALAFRAKLELAVALAHGSIANAAQALGYSLRSMQNYMRKAGIPPGRSGRKPKI